KMTLMGGPGRALGRGLAQWEKLARDPDATIALALSTPVVAEGLRELLVHAVEHRSVDVVIVTADDLFADLYEALGHTHLVGEDGPEMTEEGRMASLAHFAAFLDTLPAGVIANGTDLWRALGMALPTSAPRKGLLQAAAAAEVRLFSTSLTTSPF